MSWYKSVRHDMYRAMLTHVMYFFLRHRFWQRVLLFSRLMSGLIYMRVFFWHIILKMSGQERESCLFCPLFMQRLTFSSNHPWPPHNPWRHVLGCRVVLLACASLLRTNHCVHGCPSTDTLTTSHHRCARKQDNTTKQHPPHLPCPYNVTCTSFSPWTDAGGVCYEAKGRQERGWRTS